MSRVQINNQLIYSRYADKINLVCEYISKHLDDELSVESLSQIACLSKYHFHRQFCIYAGINMSKYILLMRLKQASHQLVYHPELRIIDIAFTAKFENPESFSRMFKKVFAQTPSQFRKNPIWEVWHQKMHLPKMDSIKKFEKNKNMQVEIIENEEIKVAVLEHCGPAELLNHSISLFIEWRKSNNLSPVKTCNTYGIAFGDPKTTPPQEFRFDVCGEIKRDVPENPQGVINKSIPAGRCAKLRHLGSRDNMETKIYYLYRDWLVLSGEKLRDFPCYFHYINLFPEVSEHELITDIYLPIQ